MSDATQRMVSDTRLTIQKLYLQGFTIDKIAAECALKANTVRQYITRLGLAKKSKEIAFKAAAAFEKAQNSTLTALAKDFIDWQSRDIAATAATLQGFGQPTDLCTALLREQVLEKLNQRARKTFGLDESSKHSGFTVNVQLLSDSTRLKSAIDVPTVLQVVDQAPTGQQQPVQPANPEQSTNPPLP